MRVQLSIQDSNNTRNAQVYPPNKAQATAGKQLQSPALQSFDDYQKLYQESIRDAPQFWANQARKMLAWSREFETTMAGSLADGNLKWFVGGQLNACFNCVDRHAFVDPDRVAIIFEADEVGCGRKLTYGQLLDQVCKLAWVLKESGLVKGDTAAIYMPMIPEAIIAILACTRLGIVHSVVFGGFSPRALRDRILDSNCKIVITADESVRGGKTITLKQIVDVALEDCPEVASVLVYQRTGAPVNMVPGRDTWYHEETRKWPSYIPPEAMDAEDPLFLLYTSGSTGKPKGLMHTTAGYLLGAAVTTAYVFDVREGDCFFCGGDIGWITGHTYLLYGPLLLGVSTVVFEGTPAYPSYSRYWDIIETHKVTQLHSAPTVLRLLKRAGDSHIRGDLSNLRSVGCVGEPIAAEVWKWCYDVIGKGRINIIDTYFQTETGANVLTPLAGITPTKPGSATYPFFGIELVLFDAVSGNLIHENDKEGVLCIKQPWPSMARTVYGDHERYLTTYLKAYQGHYFTGDGAARDRDGCIWIRGRVDDVVNISGHRLSTAEIESALLEHPAVAETAVVGTEHEVTGQALNAFVAARPDYVIESATSLHDELIAQVRGVIGPFAAPKAIYIVPDLPKTRSGKIMRRILRKILAGETEQIGDTTTLMEPTVVGSICEIVRQARC